jgi:hypothetical protein
MNWMAWIAVLVVWPLVGLGVACLFGRFIRGAEAPDNAGDLMSRSSRARLARRERALFSSVTVLSLRKLD